MKSRGTHSTKSRAGSLPDLKEGRSSVLSAAVRNAGELPRSLEVACRLYEDDIFEKHGFAVAANPVVRLVDQIGARILDVTGHQAPLKVRVLADGSLKNAFALPNGTVCLCPSLLSNLKSEDEIAALIAHEYIHVLRGHSVKALEHKQPTAAPLAALKTMLGLGRIAETEADVLGAVEILAKIDYNPLGMVELLKSLENISLGWDPDHGSALDRRLNVGTLVPHVHLTGSEKPLTPVQEEVTNALAEILTAQGPAPSKSEKIPNQSRSLSHRPPLVKARGRLENESSPKGLERAAKLTRRLALLVDVGIENAASKSRKGGRLNVVSLEKNIESDSTLVRRIAALSNLLAGFDSYLASSAEAARLDIHRDARRFLLVQWLGAEARIDYFKEMPGSTRCRLDLSCLRLGSQHKDPKLYDICHASLDDEMNGTDVLAAVADSYNPVLVDLLPSLYSVERVCDPRSVLFWAHRETAVFLDEDGEYIDATKMLAHSTPCLFNYRSSLDYIGSERKAFVTAELASDILKQVVEFEDAVDEDPTRSVIANGQLADQVTFLYRLKTIQCDDLAEEVLQRLWDDAQVIPARERIGALITLSDSAIAANKWEVLHGRFEEHLRDRGTDIVSDVRAHLEGSDPAAREAILGSIISMASTLQPTSHPDVYRITQGLLLLTAEFAPPYTGDESKEHDGCARLLWLGHSVPLSKGFNDYFFMPARSGLEEAELLQKICELRFGGDINAMVRSLGDEMALLQEYFEGMVDEILKLPSVQEQFDRLSKHTSSFPITYALIGEQAYDNSIGEKSEALLEMLAPHAKSAMDFFALCPLVRDPDLRGRASQYAAQLAADGAEFTELKALVLEDPLARIPLASKASERLAEDLANSGEQLEEVSSGLIKRALNLSARRMGEYIALDGILHHALEEPEEFLLGGLETVHDETRLARYLINSWWKVNTHHIRMSVATVVNFSEENAVAEWLDDSALETIDGIQTVDPTKGIRISTVLDELYSASPLSKAFLVRKMLTGEQGILHDREKAHRVLTGFVDRYVALPESYRETVHEVCKALVEVATIDELYFRIAPFLMRAIFQRPPARADGGAIIHDLDIPELAVAYVSDSHLDEQDYERLAYLKAYNLLWGRQTLDGEISAEAASHRAAGSQKLWERLPMQYKEASRFETLDAASAIRQALGAEGQIGARAAQVIPQYWKLPADIAPAFHGVYDQQPGQLKTEAYRTIHSFAPELIRPADLLEPRIGGGSLATVYPLKRAFEGKRVAKVLNPNAELRVRETTSLWSRVLTHLEEKTGKPGYRFFRDQLVQDIAEWLISDITDERFSTLDSHFYDRWNGYKLGNARLVVPRSERVESIVGEESCIDPEKANRYIKIDEMIDGTNLTELKIGGTADIQNGFISQRDYESVMRLLITNYGEQLLTGVAHSNPHPGNFRVLFDRGPKGEIQVAVLDRNFYLEFPPEERARIKGLALSAAQPAQLSRAVIDAIIATPENQDVDRKVRDQVLEGLQFNGLESVDLLARRLKECGVKVPLRYTLLLVNINAFDQMCKAAGMHGIADAFDKLRLLKAATFGS